MQKEHFDSLDVDASPLRRPKQSMPASLDGLGQLSLSVQHEQRSAESRAVPPIPLTVTEPTPIATSPPPNPFGSRRTDSLPLIEESGRASSGDSDYLSVGEPASVFDVDSELSDIEPTAPTSRSSSPSFGVSAFTRKLRKSPSRQNLHSVGSNLVGAGLLGAAAARPDVRLDYVVLVKARNETGCEVRPARWPTKMKKLGRTTYELSHFRA